MHTPNSITQYLRAESITDACQAFLCLDDQSEIVLAKGQVSGVELTCVSPDELIEVALPFLVGLLPTTKTATVIQNVHVKNDEYFDIHLFHDEHGQWVLFFDQSESGQEKQQEQQLLLDLDYARERKAGGS